MHICTIGYQCSSSSLSHRGNGTSAANDGPPKLWHCTQRIPGEGVGAGTRLPEFVFSGPDIVQGQIQPNKHTNNQIGFTELDKLYQQSVSSIPDSSSAKYFSSEFRKQGSLYGSYSSSGYITGNSSLSYGSSQATLNDDYYSGYEDLEFEKRYKIHNVYCLYQINEEFVVKHVGSMMELIKYPQNNAKKKAFDDTDGYRLPI